VIRGMPALATTVAQRFLMRKSPWKKRKTSSSIRIGSCTASTLAAFVLDGWPYQVGEGSLVIPSRQIQQRGDPTVVIGQVLLPHVVEREKLRTRTPKGRGVAWLPHR